MLAVPVHSADSSNPDVAGLYGNAVYFALIDEKGQARVVENGGQGNGIETVRFLATQGVSSTLYIHLGSGPYKALQERGVRVFYLGKEEMPLSRALSLYKNGKLQEVTEGNKDSLLDPGTPSGACQCGCEPTGE